MVHDCVSSLNLWNPKAYMGYIYLGGCNYNWAELWYNGGESDVDISPTNYGSGALCRRQIMNDILQTESCCTPSHNLIPYFTPHPIVCKIIQRTRYSDFKATTSCINHTTTRKVQSICHPTITLLLIMLPPYSPFSFPSSGGL